MNDLDEDLDPIRAGDEAAFGRWVSRAEDPLRRSLASFARQVDTEAIVQETLLRVWNAAPRLERTGANSLLRYAMRAARHLAISEARRRRPDFTIDDPGTPFDSPAPGAPPDPFLRERIRECLGKLPHQPKAALRARLEDGGAQPDRALAAAMRITLNTFHQNIARARRLLLECLRGHGIEVA